MFFLGHGVYTARDTTTLACVS